MIIFTNAASGNSILSRSATFKFIVSLFFVLVSANKLFAQPPVYVKLLDRDTIKKSAAVFDTAKTRKRFGHGAILLGVAEVTPWVFDRYVAQKDYAKISFKTVGHNLNPSSWAFDNDNFQTNQFGHPYHGSYFFNAYRTSGYSFWESVPAPFVGSYIWESTAENQPPAPNDFINTSFGGVILGEMTFRLSNKIINNQARGFKRQVSEVFGLLVDPMNGLNRILNGKWGKVSANSKERDSSKVYAEFDLGLRRIGDNLDKGNPGWYGHARLLYGTPYENYRTPFSNISINAELGKDDSTMVNVVSVYGSLAGWEISSSEKSEQLAVLSANYDYIHNAAFFYGGQSVKINLFSEYDLSDKIKINTQAGTGAIILGAAPDKYLYRGRNYDYGSGVGYNASAGINLWDKLFYNINYRGAWLKTINGNASHYFLHTVSSELSYMMIKGMSLAAEPGYFVLKGYYKNTKFDDVAKKYRYVRVSVRYSVNL